MFEFDVLVQTSFGAIGLSAFRTFEFAGDFLCHASDSFPFLFVHKVAVVAKGLGSLASWGLLGFCIGSNCHMCCILVQVCRDWG